jgi:galactokinase
VREVAAMPVAHPDELVHRFGPGPGEIRTYLGPGRVNLIGEHLDYNGGLVLPAAIDLGITALVRRRADRRVRFASLAEPASAELDLAAPIVREPCDAWAAYPKGVLAGLAAAGVPLVGLDVLFASDLPEGAGLSSSAALEVVTAFLARAEAGVGTDDRVGLARLCQAAENDFVGVKCGIMDQFAVACGRAGHALRLDCATLACTPVPVVLGDARLVVLNTNRRRGLADSKYHERRAECDAALALIRAAAASPPPDLAHARLADVDAALAAAPVLRRRARHVVSEQARVEAAAARLADGDLDGFGALLAASHASLRDDYEVTGPELDAIVAAAAAAPGCRGARMTGAGFGGCALALCEAAALPDFARAVASEYHARTGRPAGVYPVTLTDGVRRVA